MAKRTDPAFIARAENGGLRLWMRLVLIVLVGVLASYISLKITDTMYRNSLQSRVDAVASILDAQKIHSLTDKGNHDYQDNYDYLKAKLASAKRAIGNARFVYLLADNSGKDVYFLVDSEVAGSDGFSPNGEVYPEASEALRASFTEGKSFVEGPLEDHWGNWLSALSPIKDGVGKPVAMLGVDVPAASYMTLMAVAAGVPLLATGVVAGIVIMTENLRRKRQEALRMRSELVSIASHELRSPLAGLRWSQELMMSYPLDEKAKKSLTIMHNSTIKLQESIEDVLQLANLQSSTHHRLDVNQVDMLKLLTDVFSVQQPVADERHISLIYSDGWPAELVLSVDERRMKRVFNNLVSNAIKYGRENTDVTVGYQQTRDKYVISVSDHGIGIPKTDQEKVFSGFYRADNARRASVDGTGMGLYLSRAIVEQHGGALWLDSSEQAGTTVYVSLPLAVAAATSSGAMAPQLTGPPKPEVSAASPAPEQIAPTKRQDTTRT